MEKVFLIKRTIGNNTEITVQVPPHEALIETYLKHMYGPQMKVIVAPKAKIPTNTWYRTFIDFDDDGNVEIDMTKAKGIFMQQLRYKRGRALSLLDQNYCQAYDNQNQQKMDTIEKEKTTLRDLPAQFNLDSAKTIADLEALWPTSLLGTFGEM